MNLNILIIEDETLVALHIKKILIAMGHNVLQVAKNADQALSLAETNRVDLVISDIKIDGVMDGVDCVLLLQEKYIIPTIFITAYRDVATLQRASKVDFVGYLVKPFREDELETMVNIAILRYGLTNEEKCYGINQDYSYSYQTNRLYLKNKEITLTKKEQLFINAIVQARGKVVAYESLEELLWNNEVVSEGSRRQFIYRLKQKAPNFPLELIKNIGYKLKN